METLMTVTWDLCAVVFLVALGFLVPAAVLAGVLLALSPLVDADELRRACGGPAAGGRGGTGPGKGDG